MGDQIKEKLATEIIAKLELLGSLEPDSDEYRKISDNICKLYKVMVDADRADMEWNAAVDRSELEKKRNEGDEALKREQFEREDTLRRGQLAEQVKDRYYRLGMEAAGIVLPLIFYGIWMNKGFRFEENGTYTSTTFRGLFNRFRPTKK